jgi:hypothetical protein
VTLSIVLLLPAAGAAQQPPSDPEPDSPSGTVYELPFDRGRDDAAPRKRGSQDDRDRSSIRSENNFGSSTTVPGVDDAEGEPPSSTGNTDGDVGSGASGNEDSGEDTGNGGDDDRGDGAGGSGGGGSGGGPPPLTPTSAADEPSGSAVVPMLVLILIVGAAIGLLSGRALRRRAGT